MSALEWTLLLGGGFLAGAINTLAGNGSAITLTLLIELVGLPPNVANGTNRVGILMQTVLGSAEFARRGKLKLQKSKLYILLIVLGAIAGVVAATQVSNDQFRSVYKFMLLAMLPLILLKPRRWLYPKPQAKPLPFYISVPIFLVLGFYGGFIQMGMGLFFLAAMVLLARFELIHANAIKLFVVGLYTFFVLLVFAYQGLIDWEAGLILASAQASGGWLSAYWAARHEHAARWAYRLLIVVVVIAIYLAFFR